MEVPETTLQPLPMTADELETYRLHRRFDRMGRLVGDRRMKKLAGAHVMVIGLGGVGSWTAESLVRSGVGKVSVVDFDDVCVTNFNRQLHAVKGCVGKKKATVMAERLRGINPGAEIIERVDFYNAAHADRLFADRPDWVVDGIDNVTAKCHLLAYCKAKNIPVVCSTGSGGRIDPTQIRIADLAQTTVDPLARAVRWMLRADHAFSRDDKEPFGITAVYSTEPAAPPEELRYDNGKGFRCVCPTAQNEFFECDNRNLILGNASFVTGTFGLFCASIVVRSLVGDAP